MNAADDKFLLEAVIELTNNVAAKVNCNKVHFLINSTIFKTRFFSFGIKKLIFKSSVAPVSYTHLDVYKRQN